MLKYLFGRWTMGGKTGRNFYKRMASYKVYSEEVESSVEWEGQYKCFAWYLCSCFKAVL